MHSDFIGERWNLGTGVFQYSSSDCSMQHRLGTSVAQGVSVLRKLEPK